MLVCWRVILAQKIDMLPRYCAVSYSLPLASLIIGVVDGLGAGVTNTKSVLYRSCFTAKLCQNKRDKKVAETLGLSWKVSSESPKKSGQNTHGKNRSEIAPLWSRDQLKAQWCWILFFTVAKHGIPLSLRMCWEYPVSVVLMSCWHHQSDLRELCIDLWSKTYLVYLFHTDE